MTTMDYLLSSELATLFNDVSTELTPVFDFFTSEWFWMPSGYTWSDFEENTKGRKVYDIFIYPFLIAVVIFYFRKHILIPHISTTIAKFNKIKSKPYRPPEYNYKLEQLYKVNRARPPTELLIKYAKEIDWTERRVERWLQQKALSLQMTTLEKFHEQFWQFSYYSCYCIFGLTVVATQDWCWDPVKAFDNFPRQTVTNELWWYYMICAGFYIVQTILLYKQDRKHDFNQMRIHHICILCILPVSWIMGTHRLTSLSILYHEVAHVPLSFGKLFIYSGKINISNNFAVLFCVLWFITRLFLYPYNIILTSYNSPTYINSNVWPAYLVQMSATVLIFILYLIWTTEIMNLILHSFFASKVVVDCRYSQEEMPEKEQNVKIDLPKKYVLKTNKAGNTNSYSRMIVGLIISYVEKKVFRFKNYN